MKKAKQERPAAPDRRAVFAELLDHHAEMTALEASRSLRDGCNSGAVFVLLPSGRGTTI